MKKMLNTLYVTTETAYLALDGENVVVRAEDPETNESRELGRTPLHLLDGIVTFGYVGASPALLGKCAEYGKDVTFLSPSGRFLCRTVGRTVPVGGSAFQVPDGRPANDRGKAFEQRGGSAACGQRSRRAGRRGEDRKNRMSASGAFPFCISGRICRRAPGNGGRRSAAVFQRVRRAHPAAKGGFPVRRAQPKTAARSRQRHAVLRLFADDCNLLRRP